MLAKTGVDIHCGRQTPVESVPPAMDINGLYEKYKIIIPQKTN